MNDEQLKADLAVLASDIAVIRHQGTTRTQMLVSIDLDAWMRRADALQRIHDALNKTDTIT